MALNGSTSVAVTAYDTLKFSWAQYGQSTVNNLTTITWSLQLISGSAGEIISSATKNWSVTINGTTYTGTNSVAIGNNTTKTLASGQVSITHDADGSKRFSYSFSQVFGITFAGAPIGTISGSGTGTLNTIPRATQPTLSASSADMGGSVTISTPRASASFTHDLAYSFAGSGYIAIATGVTTSHSWTIPISLASSIPNTTSGTVTIRCITKNGSVDIGTKTVLLTAKVPTTVAPSISSVVVSEATSGLASLIGAFVQNKTTLAVAIAAQGVYGSTIKSYSTTILGKAYTGASFTSDVITLSGSIGLVTTVTDSRGRSTSKTTNVTVLSYTAPQITTFSVARYNASGVADPDGVYVRARLVYEVTPLNNKNTATARLQYKRSGDSTWSNLSSYTSMSIDGTLMPQSPTFSTDYQWDFRVTLTDAFNSATPATYTAVLPSGEVILDIRADGKGLAFFKTATKAGVEIAGELPGSAVSLTTNANLNNLTSPGFYVIPTTTISATITNKPYTDTATASIRVERTGDGMVKQILQKSTKTDGAIYERGYDSSGWGAWSMVYAGAGKLLWSGTTLLSDANTITLSEAISAQQNGIVAVFNLYSTSTATATNYGYTCHYIPKQLLTAVVPSVNTVLGVTLMMAESKYAATATKFLRITDTTINGTADNTATGTANGITYNNSRFALRYVIGV